MMVVPATAFREDNTTGQGSAKKYGKDSEHYDFLHG
jgi:hypothetical protein